MRTLNRIKQNWHTATDSEKRTFILEVVKTVATIVVAFGVFATYWGGQQERQINAERLVTDRFSKAVEQLGSQNNSTRIGGIYALERIARDSPRDHWTTMEVLTAFVREKSPNIEDSKQKKPKIFDDQSLNLTRSLLLYVNEKKKPRISIDVQSALTVISRRNSENDAWGKDSKLKSSYLDLKNTNLGAANLSGSTLTHANLKNTNLSDADLTNADLRSVNLQISELADATLKGANLEKIDLSGSDLRRVNLEGANLTKASLWESNIENAKLVGSDLTGANLFTANLKGSSLIGTNFKNASLKFTNLEDTDLRETKNLVKEQLAGAFFCNTRLPDGEKSDRDCNKLRLLHEK